MIRSPNMSSGPTNVIFAPAHAFHLLTLGIMVLAIGAGLAKYFGWIVGITMGLALSFVFSALAKMVLAPMGSVSRSERIMAGIFSLALFCITMGLSYGTLYARLFAQSSALSEFSRQRAPIERQLETAVLSNAEAAVKAFSAWQSYSEKKEAQEGAGGGTCPGRTGSLGTRGPIAKWRETEASIAANLHSDLKIQVRNLRGKLDVIKQRKAISFFDTRDISEVINSLISSTEGLSRGAGIASMQATLSRQLASTITWPNGEIFRCKDTARDELIMSAQAALAVMSDPQNNPPLQTMAPTIDLSNQQELTIRGLLRVFNAISLVISLGTVGSFVDDPLMEFALKNKGLINRETIGFFIAGLIELCVLFTGFLAARSGSKPFHFWPVEMLVEWEIKLAQQKNLPLRWLSQFALSFGKFVLNLLFVLPTSTKKELTPIWSAQDMTFGDRELGWSRLLLPYLLANHDGAYLLIPNTENNLRAQLVAQTLAYEKLAVLLNLDVSWQTISKKLSDVDRFKHNFPDINETNFSVYKLTADFAQAIRLHILGSESHKLRI